MTAFEIPIASNASHFVQENEIAKKSFFFEFEWIERGEFWLLHIADGQEKPLASGITLRPEWPFYSYFDSNPPLAFMLLPLRRGYELDRQSLSQYFTLVVYEAL